MDATASGTPNTPRGELNNCEIQTGAKESAKGDALVKEPVADLAFGATGKPFPADDACNRLGPWGSTGDGRNDERLFNLLRLEGSIGVGDDLGI